MGASKSSDGKGQTRLATPHFHSSQSGQGLTTGRYYNLGGPIASFCFLRDSSITSHSKESEKTRVTASLALLTLRTLSCSTQLSLLFSFLSWYRQGTVSARPHPLPGRIAPAWNTRFQGIYYFFSSYTQTGWAPPLLSVPHSLGLWDSWGSLQSLWHLPFLALLTCGDPSH